MGWTPDEYRALPLVPQVGIMFQRRVLEGGSLRVLAVDEKDDRRQRPAGLNTVEMLKVRRTVALLGDRPWGWRASTALTPQVASSALNLGPQHAMTLAERLYTQGENPLAIIACTGDRHALPLLCP